MGLPAPPIDQRTAPDIVAQVERLLQEAYLADCPHLVPPQGVSAALIGIFGRLAEIIIQRLNKVPEKNLLAFMDVLGASLLPPQPARVPLTFALAAGSVGDGVVQARTQVAAQPAEGETTPIIFETERELVVTAAQLTAMFLRDPAHDRYADYRALTTAGAASGLPVFQGDTSLEHLLYLGHRRLLGLPNIVGWTVTLTFGSAPQDAMTLQWEGWDGAQWQRHAPLSDQTVGAVRTMVFAGIAPIPLSDVNNVESRWLRARLLTPISLATVQQPGRLRASQLPVLQAVTFSFAISRQNIALEAACANTVTLDVSKDFFPFGEKPRFGDTLYLAQREAFAEIGATITLAVTLTNPKDATVTPPLPKTRADGNPRLTWEFWDGLTWLPLGTAVSNQDTTLSGFRDTTQALTKSGQVTLTLPKPSVALAVNGIENLWLRVRLVAGHYGEEAQYVEDSARPAGYRFTAASFAPPSVNAIQVSYSLSPTTQPPEQVQTYNDFAYMDITTASFTPFTPTRDSQPTLYTGFTLPAARTVFPNRPLSLYVHVPELLYGTPPDNPFPVAAPRLVWEAGSAQQWTPLTVRDETQALTRSGLVEFLPPADTALRSEFGLTRYWVRVRWESGEYRFVPHVQQVLLNTTMALQAETVAPEILGSSDGGEHQRLQTTRWPILAGQGLDVREPEMPAIEERAVIEREEGAQAITELRDATGRPIAIWVRWHEVPDFYSSGPRSRHYVLNRLTGEIRFGDALRGLIPPLGTGNIRMTSYQTGGGLAGNKPPGSVVQLKTTIPYVDSVTNTAAASAGADAERIEALLDRAPRTIRHRGRAVTLEDYADLALLASPEVARAKCVPLRHLLDDPLDEQSAVPGVVSVIIVPRSTQVQPQPSVELVTRVQDYLARHSVPTATVCVVGPLYIRVHVSVEIALQSLEMAGVVEQEAAQKLVAFLHPLTGGADGTGWHFGRTPHASDVYALLGTVPGVDHITALTMQEFADPPGLDLAKVQNTGRFLVYSGMHTIRLIF